MRHGGTRAIEGAHDVQSASPGSPVGGQAVNAYVVTMGCEDFDAIAERILAQGGAVAVPKAALTGMAWQGYFTDTEGNIFGLHQPDPEAA